MDAAQDARLYWIWLQLAIPPGHPAAGRLLRDGVRPETVFAADDMALEAMGLSRFDGLRDKSLHAAQAVLERNTQAGCFLLTPDDPLYPVGLRALHSPPLVLYGEGEIPAWQDVPAIGVVGTRRASREGRHNATALAAGLAAGGMVVVSGGAGGIDEAAHTGALLAGGVTVLVKAKSLDDPYPPETAALRRQIVQQGGLLLSESPPGCGQPCDFHARNRLIAGLSQGVCLVEAPRRSGALITAHAARELGRDVFVMPGEVSAHKNDGGHREIREGATLVTCAQDILEEYADRYPQAVHPEKAAAAQALLETHGEPRRSKPARPAAKERATAEAPAVHAPAQTPATARPAPADISPEAARVWEALASGALSEEALAERTSLPAARLLSALTELEILGHVRRLPGQRYALHE